MKMAYHLKGLPFYLRILLFSIIEILGMAVQNLVEGGFIWGTLIMIAGWAVMWAKNYDNRPKDQGYEEWKPVSIDEVERIRSNINRSKNTSLPVYLNPTARGVFIILLIIAVFISFFASAASESGVFFAVVLDIFIIFVPLLFSGLVKLWVPGELTMKLNSFTSILDVSLPNDLKLTPYLRFDKDKQGREIPEDLRFLLEKKRMPDDLVGAQFQIAINSGPNGKVPYMYAVLICRGKGKSYNTASNRRFKDFVVEAGGDEEYGTVVVRQETSGGGYFTDDQACKRLFKTMAEHVRNV
ncbi:MAG: hypothetical protein ACLFST_10575 [Spirochaetia bacterium]